MYAFFNGLNANMTITIASDIAVIISLGYLVLQSWQADRNQRALIQQGRATRIAVTAMRMAEFNTDDRLGRCYDGDPSVTEAELRRFLPICRANFVSAEDYKLLDGLAFRSFEYGLKATLRPPGFRIAWTIMRDFYEPAFREYMDSLVAGLDTESETSRAALWSAEAAKRGITPVRGAAPH